MNERTKEIAEILDEWRLSDRGEVATVLAIRLINAVNDALYEQDIPLQLQLRLIRLDSAYEQTEHFKKVRAEYEQRKAQRNCK